MTASSPADPADPAPPSPDPDLPAPSPRRALLAGSATISTGPVEPLGDGLFRHTRVILVADGVFKHPFVRVTETLRHEGMAPPTSLDFELAEESQFAETLEEVADHVVVRAREGINADQLRDAIEDSGLSILQALDTPDTYVLQIPFHTVQALPHGLKVAGQLEEVIAHAQPNTIFHASFTTPNDLVGALWGLYSTDKDSHINAPETWSLTTGSREVVVAVIDTGVDYRHPDLAANMWVNPDPLAADRHGGRAGRSSRRAGVSGSRARRANPSHRRGPGGL